MLSKTVIMSIENSLFKINREITQYLLETMGVARVNSMRLFTLPEYVSFERGDIDGDTFYNTVIPNCLKQPLALEQVKSAYVRHITDNTRLIDFVIDGTFPLILVGNTTEWSLPKFQLSRFKYPIFKSSDLHYRKEDLEFFEIILAKAGVLADEIRYLGTELEDVQAAKDAGIQNADVITNTDMLCAELDGLRSKD